MSIPHNNHFNPPKTMQGGREDPDRRDAPARVPSDLPGDHQGGKHGGQQGDVQQPGQNPDGGQGGEDKEAWDQR